ncbi:MAG: PAS domain-containing protein, partial [Dehalococcoidia bacterium]
MHPTSAPLPSDPPSTLPLYFAAAGRETGTGIAFVDRDARFLFVSEGMAAINGLPVEQHLGRCFGDLWPEAWSAMSGYHERVLAGAPVTFTLTLPPGPDGRRGGTFQAYWSPVRDEAGEVIGVAATVVDTTELGRSQARDHEFAARQGTLRAIANQALSDVPMQEVFQEATAALQRHLGLPFVRAMRVVAGSDRLEVYAEHGWDAEIVRQSPVGPRRGSFADYVLASSSTVQFPDLIQEHRFRRPGVFLAHGIRSGVGVRVSTGDRPWGVLGGYDVRERTFDCDEIGFIEELAAILGLMVHERESRAFREEVLSMASHQMRTPLTSVIGLAQHIQRRIKQGRVDTTPDLIESLVAE